MQGSLRSHAIYVCTEGQPALEGSELTLNRRTQGFVQQSQ